MSNDGKMEKSFVSFKAAHPEWMPADPSGSLYLSRIADLSARRASDDQTPRPNVTGRTREYELALHESQTAAVRRRGVGVGVGFGTTSAILGQSTGTVYQSGMAQSVSLGDSDGSVAVANFQPPAPAPVPASSSSSSSAGAVDVVPRIASGVSSSGSGSGFGEIGADSQGEVRSALGESYVDGARRHPRGGGVSARSMQEEEDEDGLGADGGVLGLLAQIYNGTSGGGGAARGVLS